MMEEFEGIWDIQELEDWEHSDLHEMGIPHFKITRGGKRLVFKWEGSNGDHEDGGIGEIRLGDKNTIEGELSFEYTGESTFIAKRRKEKLT